MIYYLIIFSFIIIFTLVLTLTNFNFINSNNSNKVSKPLSINNNFVMKNKIVEQYHKTSGWHLSYFFHPEQILDKLKSYSHCNDKRISK